MHRDDWQAHQALLDTPSRFRAPVRITYPKAPSPNFLTRILRALFN